MKEDVLVSKPGTLFCVCVVIASVLLASPAFADSITWDFASGQGGSYGSGSFGNSRTYTYGGVTVTVTAWGYTDGALETGAAGKWGTGLGGCNQSEGASCGSPYHQVDNVGDDDWMLFVFDQTVDFTNVNIDPYGTWDRDASYWVGNVVSGDLTGVTYAGLGGLGFGPQFDDYSSSSYLARDVSISGGTGNALLFGALRGEPSSAAYKDRFKIKSLTALTVSEPSTLLLFGAGLAAVGHRRRRKP